MILIVSFILYEYNLIVYVLFYKTNIDIVYLIMGLLLKTLFSYMADILFTN